MFDPEEREEIFEENQTYSNVLAILYFLEKGAQPTVTVHDIFSKAEFFQERIYN
ncbi:hypothetical protein KSP40_PGU005932 [Platanthera guangdongensis]|uniref:Uncharacterized protein n=1 Tax=Platanthera guangdongensis TaxID=2320717 RepID=A0ABR2MJX7_9ASPA